MRSARMENWYGDVINNACKICVTSRLGWRVRGIEVQGHVYNTRVTHSLKHGGCCVSVIRIIL
jgi:hypothetical protein